MAINFTYAGTSGAFVVQVAKLRSLVDEVETLLNTAIQQKNVDLMKTWFGKNFEGGRAAPSKLAVINGCTQIQQYITNNVIEFVSKDVNTFAFADQAKQAAYVNLGKWFGYKWFTWGDRIVTLIHELSHKCAMQTKDRAFKGEPAYKYKCVQLAEDTSSYAQALSNAENWGYFIASHYKLAGFGTPGRVADWKYVARNQLESRGQPSENDKDKMGNDPALMENGTWTLENGRRVQNGLVESVPAIATNPQHRIFEYIANGGQPVVEHVLV